MSLKNIKYDEYPNIDIYYQIELDQIENNEKFLRRNRRSKSKFFKKDKKLDDISKEEISNFYLK